MRYPTRISGSVEAEARHPTPKEYSSDKIWVERAWQESSEYERLIKEGWKTVLPVVIVGLPAGISLGGLLARVFGLEAPVSPNEMTSPVLAINSVRPEQFAAAISGAGAALAAAWHQAERGTAKVLTQPPNSDLREISSRVIEAGLSITPLGQVGCSRLPPGNAEKGEVEPTPVPSTPEPTPTIAASMPPIKLLGSCEGCDQSEADKTWGLVSDYFSERKLTGWQAKYLDERTMVVGSLASREPSSLMVRVMGENGKEEMVSPWNIERVLGTRAGESAPYSLTLEYYAPNENGKWVKVSEKMVSLPSPEALRMAEAMKKGTIQPVAVLENGQLEIRYLETLSTEMVGGKPKSKIREWGSLGPDGRVVFSQAVLPRTVAALILGSRLEVNEESFEVVDSAFATPTPPPPATKETVTPTPKPVVEVREVIGQIAAYNSPSESNLAGTIYPGKSFKILEKREDWWKIKMIMPDGGNYGAEGWIKAKEAEFLTDVKMDPASCKRVLGQISGVSQNDSKAVSVMPKERIAPWRRDWLIDGEDKAHSIMGPIISLDKEKGTIKIRVYNLDRILTDQVVEIPYLCANISRSDGTKKTKAWLEQNAIGSGVGVLISFNGRVLSIDMNEVNKWPLD